MRSTTTDLPGLLARSAEAAGREWAVDETWVSVRSPGGAVPDQGWKLHISARPGTLEQTVDIVLPLLLAHDCDFKVARSPEVLRELNSGDVDPATVGKAMTVYPPQDDVVRLGGLLAEALAGMTGPRITSDRRIRPDSPVYYRYAPFRPQYRVDDNGDFELVVLGPDGTALPGAAGPEFSCPPWATDPFRPAESAQRATVLGGRFRLTSGVLRGPRGNVYRAVDPEGRQVVIKEARAHVGENVNGIDLRMQLRNERRVLQALDGVDGVPRLLDHFRHGEDEYLVTTDVGTRDLNRYVGEQTRFFDDPTSPDRDLVRLASRLADVLAAVHERGVVVRDLSPKNVVLDDDGRCTLIDFGNSHFDGFQLHGWTRGYSVPDQHTDRPAEASDDYFSLGATLFFAATGINPIGADPDPVRNLERTLLCLDRLYPEATGVRALIPGLLSLDPAERTAAFEALRTDRPARRGRRPEAPVLSADLLESVLSHTVGECVAAAREMASQPTGGRSEPPKTNVYSGSAGLGLELLHHPEGIDAGIELARWTIAATPPTRLPAAMYFGRTGTEIFLATARRTGAELPVSEPVDLGDERADYIHGVAGIGAGHLVLHAVEPAGGHLAVADECARRLLTGRTRETEDAVPAAPETGVALEAGFAHGSAGIAHFLLSYHQRTGDPAAEEAAAKRFAALADEAVELIQVMRGRPARPMAASWCQGMSGISSALLAAARHWDDDRYLALAKDGGRACLGLAAQAWVVSQCCGLAGMGEALIDLAIATEDEEFWRGAEEIAVHMLARSGGEYAAPRFPDNSLETSSAPWSTGTSGVLSFLRRLHDRAGERLWTPAWTPPSRPIAEDLT
ncbi:Serine/threonine protein kinase [Saccharopolyspora kobensis]|uniref:non-specific serine/threonine protein kinase n=1 Tax=Saccharopolyspora kobensis TaxID=146035 RepID=A0A1H5UN66_9PSEU|nr:class IV lanthionine synthetase LanL [Saccharopolyspora kobensis]SEF76495.1 Serine/threonine protein kinase [Saccharopolyspora kobensis]SFC71533.1 Serine/threonine protein kinase [Saccharopolyspora kobensis]